MKRQGWPQIALITLAILPAITQAIPPGWAVFYGTHLSKARTPYTVDWSIPDRYIGRTIPAGEPKLDKKWIAVTFDDGPDPVNTPKILDSLKARNQKATFFVLGWRVKRWPGLVKRMFDEGHTVANHTMMHPSKSTVERAKIEVDDTSELIKQAIGKYPTLYRPPYGIRNNNPTARAKQLGLPIVLWTISSGDTATKNVDDIIKNCTKTPRPGDIILLHDIHAHTAAAVPTILANYQANGYTLVTVDDLIREWEHQRTASER